MTALAHDGLELLFVPGDNLREKFVQVWRAACDLFERKVVFEIRVILKKITRTLAQNALMWVLLRCLERQVVWYGERLTAEEWKDVVSASWKKQRVVPGIDGGFVVLGVSTSRLSISDMTELLDIIQAFGIDRDVMFSAPAWMLDKAQFQIKRQAGS